MIPEARLVPTPKFEGEQARPGCWDEIAYTKALWPRETPKHEVRPHHNMLKDLGSSPRLESKKTIMYDADTKSVSKN